MPSISPRRPCGAITSVIWAAFFTVPVSESTMSMLGSPKALSWGANGLV